MKKNIHKKLFALLKSRGVLAVSSALLMVSCGIQPGAYSETDGVYYDPSRDTLPEGAIANGGGNRMGQYYDYQDSDRVPTQEEIVYDKYRNWGSTSLETQNSDWGTYAGSETNYYNNSSWGWGYPYGYYSGYGYGSPWGFGMSWGSPYWSFGWGSSWNWGWGYSPYYGGYNPYWYGGYSPYWGRPYYGGYNGGYYGYNSYNAPGFINRRSSSNGRVGNGNGTINPGGFRQNSNRVGNMQGNTNGRIDAQGSQNRSNSNGGFRSSQPRYNEPVRTQQSQPSYRTESYRSSGSMNSGSSGGGFRSGGFSSGSSGGGSRSGGGGFRR